MNRLVFSVIFSLVLGVGLWMPQVAVASKADTVQSIKDREKLAERVTIRYILPVGNKHTRYKIITREMSVKEGEDVLADSLEAIVDINQKRVFNLSLFTEVNVTASKVNEHVIDLIVKVKEQWYIMPELAFQLADRNFNVWWKEQDHDIRRANARVTLKHRNFRGNLEALSGTAQIGYTRKFALEYFKPYIDKDQTHGLGVSVSTSNNDETFYVTDSNKLKFVKKPGEYIISQFEAALVYTYRPAYESRHLIELRYKDVTINDTIAQLNPDYFKKGETKMKMMQMLYRYELNRVDNWNYPLQGLKLINYTTARFGFEGFDFQLSDVVEAAYFKKLGSKWFTGNILRGRLTSPVNQPYILRNALGTESEYIRGYEYYVIDGSQYGLVRNNLKYEALNTTIRNIPIRYLSSLPLRIYPKVFIDAGYVANKFPGNSFLNNKFLYSYGAGIDVVSAYDFKIRVEYAWNHLGQKGLFLHINSE
jgi:outer membrane protein assembly factor BamA